MMIPGIHYNAYYWEPYPGVSAAVLLGDGLMGGRYVADRYAVSVSAEQSESKLTLRAKTREKPGWRREAEDAAERAEASYASCGRCESRGRPKARAAKAEVERARRKEMAGN